MRFLLLVSLLFSAGAAQSRGCEVDISDYVGWGITFSGTITGYIDDEGQEIDDFSGCDYDRVLIVDYTKSITCNEYGYSYAYRPAVVILSNGTRQKACINDRIYNIKK